MEVETPNPGSMEWIKLRVRNLVMAPSTIWVSDGTLAYRIALWEVDNPSFLPAKELFESEEGIKAKVSPVEVGNQPYDACD